MIDVNSIIGLLQQQGQNPLATAAQAAERQADPPVRVVPDAEMPQYGAEVPAQTWQERLKAQLESIEEHRKEHPVRLPFEPGTKTLAAKQLAQQAELAQQRLGQQATLARERMAGGGGGGGGGGRKPPQWQVKAEGQQIATALAPYLVQYKSYADMLADLPRIAPYLPTSAYSQLQTMAKQLKNVYFDEQGFSVIPRDFKPHRGSPLLAALKELGMLSGTQGGVATEDAFTREELLEYSK